MLFAYGFVRVSHLTQAGCMVWEPSKQFKMSCKDVGTAGLKPGKVVWCILGEK